MIEFSLTSKKENKKMKNKEINKPNFWTEEEDKILKEKAEEFNYKNWNSIADFIPGRTSIQCSARYRRIRPGLIKGAWDKEEDNKLLLLYEKYGKNWAAISKEMPHRTGKQIRDRFLNSLDSKFERGKFTEEEDQAIIKYYKIYGNSWAKIAKKLKTRTGDMVKNRFYSSLKKTIFKNKSFLKRKREHSFFQKNKKKIMEENNLELKQKSHEISQKNCTKTEQVINDEQKKNNEQNIIKNKNNIQIIKNCIKDNNELINLNVKMNINLNSTNNIDYDSNNYTNNIENKNNNQNNNNINKNNSFNKSVEYYDLGVKHLLNYSENENKLENDNNTGFNLEENAKKKEISNYSELNENFRINNDLIIGLNGNVNNNFISFNPKDEVDERLEKLKNYTKFELEYRQNLKEQLDIIFDLENIINQKLFNLQKELENI